MVKHKFATGGVTMEYKIEKNQIHYSSQETTASPNNVFISEESDLWVGIHRINAW